MFSKYNYYLNKFPLLTKSITSGIIGGAGDIMAQKLTNDNFDYKRFSTFVFLQVVLVGPTLHIWYSTVFKIVPGTGMINTIKRVALDQGCFAPLFVTTFMASNLFLTGKTFNEVKYKLKEDVVTTILTNNGVWIPAQLINLGLIPPQYQVLFANFVGLFWNTYLSAMTYKERIEHPVHIVETKQE
mmetsp:Transcript_14736/g.15442  ORF Transcript_14736/g.15442 Transcript_14736/m.15442 type:complete len:185 (+) Transcript_14736:32-586(+)